MPLLVSTLSAGCFGGWGGGAGAGYVDDSSETPRGDGRISIAWTIADGAPSETSYRGVEEIELELSYSSGRTVRVAPIPCALDRFRFDNLPEGSALLTLRALDASGCALAQGQTSITVRNELPSMPSPIVSISAIGSATRDCR